MLIKSPGVILSCSCLASVSAGWFLWIFLFVFSISPPSVTPLYTERGVLPLKSGFKPVLRGSLTSASTHLTRRDGKKYGMSRRP